MGMFNSALLNAQKYFPDVNIKFKGQSLLMKLISKFMFFNTRFMDFDTTIGSTIYLPSEAKLKLNPVSSTTILLHELSHIYNNKKKGFIFGILYLLPQILAILAIPVFFLFGLLPSLLCILFLLPIPAYFRMAEERQAYTITLYVMNRLNLIDKSGINLDLQKQTFIDNFKGSNYYYMWPFGGIDIDFNDALIEIKSGGKPRYDAELYAIVDDIIDNISDS